MDNVTPDQALQSLAEIGGKKSVLSKRDIFLRSVLAGAFLGIATVLAITATIQTGLGLVGALVFPVGFVMLVLLGLELVTGNFATIPVAVIRGSAQWKGLFANWTVSFMGNLVGSVFFAALFFITATNFGNNFDTEMVKKIQAIAIQKTLFYKDLGAQGFIISFAKAMLCNWMVTTGVVMALISKSTVGKILAMWLPIFTFFALGFEHSVVNMFVIPAGMMMNAPISFTEWWIFNQIPVTLGNMVGGFFLTGLVLHLSYKPTEEVLR